MPEHSVLASALLARCRALLSGLTTLVENGEDDCVGALYRPLLESYLAGVYSLLGGEEAAEALRSAFFHESHRIGVALGLEEPGTAPDGAQRLPVSQRREGNGLVERVDRLLADLDSEYGGWAPRTHDRHYRITSLTDAHGGIGCQSGHRELTEDRSVVVRERRDDAYKALYLLNQGIALVLGFGGVWASQVGKDLGAVEDLHGRWVAVQPDSWQLPAL